MPIASANVWLLQDGEPVPIDDGARLMRTGYLAQRLVDRGATVTWWTSRFHHSRKVLRDQQGPHQLADRYRLFFLDGPQYASNISLARIRHYRACARHFAAAAAREAKPNLIVASYPSPELCDAGRRFAKEHGIAFVVDIRDPWPDMFPDYFPKMARILVGPVLSYYRRLLRAVVTDAQSVLAVSSAMLDWALSYAGRTRSVGDRVLYVGSDAGQVLPISIEARPFSEGNPLNCVFMSTCGQSYDGSMLIAAAARLHAAGERRIRFQIIGDGELRPRWMAEAAGIDTVSFTGWLGHDALELHLARGHVGVVLMRGGITRFWLGNKFFEYLAHSFAILNNVPGDAQTIVQTHNLGTNVIPATVDALVSALHNFVEHPEKIALYRANAGRAMRQEFDRARVYERYIEHLDTILAMQGPVA